MRAALADLADGTFTEGHELEPKNAEEDPEEPDRPQALSNRGNKLLNLLSATS